MNGTGYVFAYRNLVMSLVSRLKRSAKGAVPKRAYFYLYLLLRLVFLMHSYFRMKKTTRAGGGLRSTASKPKRASVADPGLCEYARGVRPERVTLEAHKRPRAEVWILRHQPWRPLEVFRLDALALSVIATATWLGGWLGVCHSRYCIKTSKPIRKLFGSSGSPII